MTEQRSDILSTREGRHNGGSASLPPSTPFTSILQADGNDAGVQLVTVTWAVTTFPLDAPAAAGSYRARGKLIWGVSASSLPVVFDLGRGGNVTLAASSIALSASNPDANAPSITVTAAAAYGTRGGGYASSVTLTEYFTNANAAGVVLPLPAFAKAVTTKPADETLFTTGFLVLEFLDIDGAIRYTHRPTTSVVAAAYEIPNNVAFVRVRHTNEAPASGALLFGLSI